MKYITLATCPVLSYGGSTGLAPIQVSTVKIEKNVHMIAFALGKNLEDFIVFLFVISSRSAKIDASSANTPPSLDGIDRRIAYANRKYHSGWMWIGVDIGFAGLKFSGSPR
jgi:hypothetical protein